MKTADDVLVHFGIKGMKWGVRRKSQLPASSDADSAAAAAGKIKKGGVKSLSNQELQALVTRMNLERQFASLAPPSKKKRAGKFIGEVLINVGKQEATKLASKALAKQVAKVLAGR